MPDSEKMRFTTGLTGDEWRHLPMWLRERWWRETQYGEKEPSKALMDLIETEKALMRAKGNGGENA